jgi:hypothetical protein
VLSLGADLVPLAATAALVVALYGPPSAMPVVLIGEELEGGGAAEALLPGEVDLAHPASAEQELGPVRGDPRPLRHGHRRRLMCATWPGKGRMKSAGRTISWRRSSTSYLRD